MIIDMPSHNSHLKIASTIDSVAGVLLLALVFCGVARAETPEQVFQRASPSVLVIHVSDISGQPVAMGSGIVSGPGAVITNCHVAQAGPQLKASHLGKSFAASLQYADTDRDLCQLSVPDLHAPSVSVADSKNLMVGQRVYAVGAPEGLELTLSEGLISAIRSVGALRYIQTTASISHGSSGGGLFDAQGRLIGITTFYVSAGQNLNFALPADWIKGLRERARVEAQAAVNVPNPESDWLLRAGEFEVKSDWQGLLQFSLHWLASNPNSAVAWGNLAESYRHLDQDHKAMEADQEAVHLDPQNVTAWFNLGVDYRNLGQRGSALQADQEAVRLDPSDAGAWLAVGVDYCGLGRRDKAIEVYQQLRELDSVAADLLFKECIIP
jgi:hypothetical protein